jgi:alanine racemase
MKSWVEISRARLAENFRAVPSAAGEDVETLAVIKANAYGHSAAICVPALVEAGARWLGVSDVEEGIAVRAMLPATTEDSVRILVMCAMEVTDAPALVAQSLTPVVWTEEHILAMEQAAEAVGTRAKVHLEIDTGMARQGVAPGQDLARVLSLIAASNSLQCEGIFTHLCCSEIVGSSQTELQQQRFADALAQAAAVGLKPAYVHVANSSAVDEGSTTAWLRAQAKAMSAQPMVRTGLALYGHCLALEGDASRAKLSRKLEPVLCWKTKIAGIREVAPGATVGYGATFTAAQPMRLALLPVGYADGFRRAASSGVGNGWVIIAGQRAPVVGRVSMNLIVVDVSEVAEAREGMEVVLLGEGVSAEDHARWAHTISYDILCGLRAHFVER